MSKITYINGMAWDASHVPQQLSQPRQLVVHHIHYRRRDDYEQIKRDLFNIAIGFAGAWGTVIFVASVAGWLK